MFGSLITAMITPFKQEDPYQIDFAAVERIVEHLIRTGTDSIIVSGTTGESPTLSHQEEQDLFRLVRNKANSIDSAIGTKTKILFGAGSNSTQTAIESSKRAEELGADGLLIVTPYYNKPNQKGIKKHYSLIAQNTSLPIILYNIPGRSVINMGAEVIIELASEYPNIVGLKEASNNLDQVSRIRQVLANPPFWIYSGDDSLTLPMMSIGANGVISVASHLVGKEIKEMINLFLKNNLFEAEKLHRKLFPLFEALFKEPNPTCIKAALGIMGLCSPVLRPPLVELDDSQRKSLKTVLDALKNNNPKAQLV